MLHDARAGHHRRCTQLDRIIELLDHASRRRTVTIGIGDGGNEIGMGKIPHETIVKNIPNGDLIHCRVPTDHLIVAGVSNWGAYALAAGRVRASRGEAAGRPVRPRPRARDSRSDGPRGAARRWRDRQADRDRGRADVGGVRRSRSIRIREILES